LAIYRKEALEHLDSPEQLDTMMRVTSPRRWTALVGLCLLIVLSLGWAVWGRVPILVSGTGVVTSEGGSRDVYATSQGQLQSFHLRAGDKVTTGQVVGSIGPYDGGPAKEILSPGSGQVVEIFADVWSPVDPTVPLYKLLDTESPLSVVLFLTPSDGAEVRPGMEVQLYPKIAGQSEYGHILGKVEEVAHQPWSTAGLTHLLNNTSEVNYLTENSLLLPLKVSLQKSAGGYRWSGSKSVKRPELYAGLICTAKIVVDTRAPISLILGSH